MNNHTTIQTAGTPTIFIDAVGGDLRVRGHDRDEVLVRSEHSYSYAYSQHHEEHDEVAHDGGDGENTIKLGTFGGDCHLHVPDGANLHVGSVGGDSSVIAVTGELLCENVGGDLKMKQVGRTQASSVGGDLRIQHIAGDFSAKSVGGDASVMDSQGDVQLPRVGGDLSLSNVQGTTITAHAGGDAMLRLTSSGDGDVHVRAGGDINCILPPDVSATVHLESEARTFHIHGWEAPQPTGERIYEHTLGDGDGQLTLSLFARGDISLVVQDESHASGDPFSGEFRAKWEHDFDFSNFEPHFEFEFDSNMAERFGHLSDEMAQRVQEKVQKAMRQAEIKVAEAMRRAEERIARAEEKAARMDERRHHRERERSRHYERDARRRSTPPVPPVPPQPPVPPRPRQAPEKTVSDEERMMVLRMVEEGKISIEQAEQLLAALKK